MSARVLKRVREKHLSGFRMFKIIATPGGCMRYCKHVKRSVKELLERSKMVQ